MHKVSSCIRTLCSALCQRQKTQSPGESTPPLGSLPHSPWGGEGHYHNLCIKAVCWLRCFHNRGKENCCPLTRASPPARRTQPNPGEELEIAPAERGVRQDPATAPRAASPFPAVPGHAPVPVWPSWDHMELKGSAGSQ